MDGEGSGEADVKELARHDSRVRGLLLARNAGSHLALCCGLEFARGNCAVALAGDCQDPPESIPQLIDEWRAGAQVVWAARASRPGETRFTLLFSRIYYFVMRRFVGFSDMPSTGADFFLLDRRVIDEIREFKETHVNILALIGWMGFRQSTIAYTKEERAQGESGWTLTKKLKLLVDSVTAFTYRPVRLMSYLGGMVTMAGLSYAVALLVSGQREASVAGWEVLIVIALVLGGLQMVMLGILGEYLWRVLEESRRRPRFMIEDATERIGRSAEVATDA